jgi:hypothetical protein
MKRMKWSLLLFFSLAFLWSCKVENNLHVSAEPIKSITGTWQIVAATENGADLTKMYDFSQFRISFTDSTYTITNLLPFMVNTTTGKWSFNDPQYPFTMTLTPTDSSSSVSSPLQYPVVGGVRNMILTFSPGCPQNSYEYTLQLAQ